MELNGEAVTKIVRMSDLKPKIGKRIEVWAQSVYDGDTFTGIYKNEALGAYMEYKFRLARIDAAELRKKPNTSETEEQKMDRLSKAIPAKVKLIEYISNQKVHVTVTGIDKYSRAICEVEMKLTGGSDNYSNISSLLLEQKLVAPYP